MRLRCEAFKILAAALAATALSACAVQNGPGDDSAKKPFAKTKKGAKAPVAAKTAPKQADEAQAQPKPGGGVAPVSQEPAAEGSGSAPLQ